MSLMSFISINCNRHGPRSFFCAFTFLVAGAVRRLPFLIAGEFAGEFADKSYLFSVAALCISITIFLGRNRKVQAAGVIAALCLWWMLGSPYPSFPSVHTRHRSPGFASFTFAIASFSRRTAPNFGGVVIDILYKVAAEMLPSVVVVLVFWWRFSDEAITVDLYERNLPSVVFVSVGKRVAEETRDERTGKDGTGSGFVWNKRGHIVTNYHVIRNESNDNSRRQVFVKLANDTKSYEAAVIGWDKQKDVAVLQVTEQGVNMKPVRVGRSANLRVGHKVYAIGNPFGLDHTLTTGVVSGLGRDLESPSGVVIEDGIQTDASINPGSSGGPLLDSSGKLVGVNAAFYSPNGASSGIGFSIAIDTVAGIIEQIIKDRKVSRPNMGIKFAPDQSQQQLGLGGVLVCHVHSNSPAQQAGILPNRIEDDEEKKGDVIISFNGEIVNNGSDLYNILDKCKAGDMVKVEVLRDGEKKELVVTLGIRQ